MAQWDGAQNGRYREGEWLAYRHAHRGRVAKGYYGERKKGNRKKADKRLLNYIERKNVVDRLVKVLDGFRLTKFEYEASCRHGLRSAFCLQGYGWAEADTEAAKLLEEALKAIGAVRPTHEDGQPHYTQSPDRCARCHGPMDKDTGRYCSPLCARAALAETTYADQWRDDRTLMAARRMVTRHNHAAIQCAQCGTSFHPLHAGIRFCSSACSSLRTKIHYPTPCAVCGVTFQPRYQGHRCCSMDCSGKLSANLRAEKLAALSRCCLECSQDFTPKTKNAVYCTEICRKRAGKKRQRAKERAAANPNIIRLPLPDPRPLTPELVDGLLAA